MKFFILNTFLLLILIAETSYLQGAIHTKDAPTLIQETPKEIPQIEPSRDPGPATVSKVEQSEPETSSKVSAPTPITVLPPPPKPSIRGAHDEEEYDD